MGGGEGHGLTYLVVMGKAATNAASSLPSSQLQPGGRRDTGNQAWGGGWRGDGCILGSRGQKIGAVQEVGQPANCPWDLCPMKDIEVPA